MKASIVIVTYNELANGTKPCIESVLRNTPAGDFELIVVDNSSTDGTPSYLQELGRSRPNIRIQLNSVNRGFAGGNNDGLKLARGDFIVLLNNDTLVPPGWLDSLLRPFATDRRIGMVGPVSNSVGNAQRVLLPGLNEYNFGDIAARYTEKNREVWFPVQQLGFFCVALRREVVEKVGLLDESYGTGMFEDDDYCLRAVKAGFRLVVHEGCFVYHKGSLSFAKLAYDDYHALFRRNRRYFAMKHGAQWTLTDIAFAYVAKFESDLREYASAGKVHPAIERVLVRVENFRHLLHQIRESELQSPENGASLGAREVSRAMWRARFDLFRREFLGGSWQQKASFARRAMRRLSRTRHRQPPAARLLERFCELVPEVAGKKVVIFPATVDFAYMTQRPQQLATAFAARGYAVIYGTLNHTEDRVETYAKAGPNLFLVNQHHFPYLSHVVTPDQGIYYCMWPNNLVHASYLPHRTLIYDYMDDLSLLDLDPVESEANHRLLMARAQLITVSSEALYRTIPGEYLGKALLVPNAVSESFITSARNGAELAPELEALRQSHKHIIGYYGAIASWFDFDLLAHAAKARSDDAFVLIGPVFEVSDRVRALRSACPNVHLFPRMPQDRLIGFLRGFDVAVIPFLKNDVTDAVSPLKLFEYLAAGKPVVCTDMLEARKYRAVLVAPDREAFTVQLEHALGVRNDAAYQRMMAEELAQNTWERRVDDIIRRIG